MPSYSLTRIIYCFRVCIPLRKLFRALFQTAYLIPQAAITRLPTGQAVAMLVNAKGVVESRPVETLVFKDKLIVTNGLKAGDKVIVDGVAKVKEGKKYQQTHQAQPANSQGAAPNAAKPAQSGKPQAEQKAASNA